MIDRYAVCNITKFIIHRAGRVYIIVYTYIWLGYSKPWDMQKYENMLEYAKEGEQTQYTKTAKHIHYVIT